MDRPLADSPDLATPRDDFDDTLVRAIDAGHLDPSQAADPQLAAAFAAHQKLASLFALLRGEGLNADGIANAPPPERLGRYVVAQPPSAGSQVRTAEGGYATVIGAGAFGTVYLARDPELNRGVAIKVSRGRAATGEAGADPLSHRERARVSDDRMATEARHAASLNHPNIVSIYDVGREGDRLYIVMQYIAGRTLADLAREGALSAARAAAFGPTFPNRHHSAANTTCVSHRSLSQQDAACCLLPCCQMRRARRICRGAGVPDGDRGGAFSATMPNGRRSGARDTCVAPIVAGDPTFPPLAPRAARVARLRAETRVASTLPPKADATSGKCVLHSAADTTRASFQSGCAQPQLQQHPTNG